MLLWSKDLREPNNSSRKKQNFNGIRNVYMQRGSISIWSSAREASNFVTDYLAYYPLPFLPFFFNDFICYKIFGHKIVNIFLPINFNICFG